MQCDLQFFSDDAQLVDQQCCDDGVSCGSGVPTKCDAKCALAYIPFFDRCSAILATQVQTQAMSSYQRLYTTCATGLEVEPLLRAAAACSAPPPAPPHIGVDDCASNPCQHGGECFDGANEYACVCPDTHYGLNCESQVPPPAPPSGSAIWIVGEQNVNCDDTCAGAGRGCTDGDWGVHDEATFVNAMVSAAQDVDTRCSHGFAGADDSHRPSIYLNSGDPTCKWQSQTNTLCDTVYADNPRLCKCEGAAPPPPPPGSRTISISGSTTPIQVRIAGGGSRGVLEVNVNSGGWGAVCDDGFGTPEVAAFCNDLGFGTGGSQYDTTHGSGSFALDDINCPSGSSHISACSVSHGAYQDNCGDSETVGIDCAPAPPPPPPAQGTFSKSGDCFLTQSNTCVHSSNHMSGSSYGNSESCTITVHGGGTLHDTGNPSFSTESCCDHLTVHGNRYDGSSGPNGVHVSDGDQISWRTDSSVTRTGWEFCLI